MSWQTIENGPGEVAVLQIIDYKFGHRFVDEYWNLQGLLYLCGILALLHPDLKYNDQLYVQFTIIQPRCFYKGSAVRSHLFQVRDAWDQIRRLQGSAASARLPTPVATTNDACRDCPGRHACPALQQTAYEGAEFSTGRNPHDLTPHAAALELRMLERALQRLEARVDGLRELTLANLRNGNSVPFYQIEHTKPRAQWTAPVEQIVEIGKSKLTQALFPCTVLFQRALLSWCRQTRTISERFLIMDANPTEEIAADIASRPKLHQMSHAARILELRDYNWTGLDYESAKRIHASLPPDYPTSQVSLRSNNHGRSY